MKSEKGQALILIAFGIVAMLSLTALALDGGNAFADRRHAQNAVDNAALSAALAILESEDGQTAAEALIIANGYDISSTRSTMQYHRPPIRGAYQGNNQYLQVILVSNVDTWFANIVGVEQVTNEVEAVARAKPWTPYFDGHAVVALNPGDGASNKTEMLFSSTASAITVSGSGVFSNSSDECAVDTNGKPSVSVPYINAPGSLCEKGKEVANGSATQFAYPPEFSHLDDLCSRANAVTINSKSFPSKGSDIVNDKIYCINGDFEITNGTYSASNVTFVVSGLVKVNGGDVTLSAAPGLPLFYLPYAANKVGNNKYGVIINGNADITLIGQFLAPASDCDFVGGAESPIRGQIICYNISLGGSSDTVVQYNDEDNADEPPQIELTE